MIPKKRHKWVEHDLVPREVVTNIGINAHCSVCGHERGGEVGVGGGVTDVYRAAGDKRWAKELGGCRDA